MKSVALLCVFALIGTSLGYYTKSYNGYQALQTKEIPSFVIPALLKLRENTDYMFLNEPRVGSKLTVMASAEHIDILKDGLNRLRLNPQVVIPDVGVHIRQEREEIEALRAASKSGRVANYNNYMTFTEIQTHLDQLVATNPLATDLNLGRSYEGRPVRGISINNGRATKRVFVDCAIHAREWMAPPVCMKLIDDVLATPAYQDLAIWDIIVVANPDGYAYTWSNDRMWRKTRKPNLNSACIGTDPNRNYNISWSNTGISECSDTWPGDVVFSEPETQLMRDRILANRNQMAIYIAVHAYGQYILYPPGWVNTAGYNKAELDAAGKKAANIINSYAGRVYTVGQSSTTLYPTNGASDDWAWGTVGVRFSYTLELPNLVSFDPPPSLILPVVTETVPGIISLVTDAVNAAKYN